MLSAVKRVRMEKGFSQQRMGEMVGIHRTIVSNIEGEGSYRMQNSGRQSRI